MEKQDNWYYSDKGCGKESEEKFYAWSGLLNLDWS